MQKNIITNSSIKVAHRSIKVAYTTFYGVIRYI